MYIQLTTRCNMSCAHCCFASNAKGRDIPVGYFRKAVELAEEHGEMIMLGGGEPTLHPEFEKLLMLAIAAGGRNEYRPWIVTNGSIKDRALLIAKLTQKEVIDGELSQDEFHDPIDPDVVKAFGTHIRDVTARGTHDPIVLAGRNLKRMGLIRRPIYKLADCPCEDTFVRPNGRIYQCGCKDSPCIGNVSSDYDSPAVGMCHRSKDYKAEAA